MGASSTSALSGTLANAGSRNVAQFLKALPLHLSIFFALLLGGIWTGIFFQLQYTNEQIIRTASQDRHNLSRAFAEQVKSSVRGIDLSLLTLREEWRHKPERFHDAVVRQQNYFVQDVSFQVGVIDAQGMSVYSNLDPQAKPVSLADREHFRVHLERQSDELFISKPVLGRLSKRWSIQFTRPILDPQKGFLGVIVMSVAPEYFSRFYDTINLGPNGAVTLVKSSGEILARSPEQGLGQSLSGRPFFAAGAGETGDFQSPGQTDGIDRIYTWRQLKEFGLIVIIGEASDSMLAPYYLQRRGYLIGGTLVSALLILFACITIAGLRQRARTAAALSLSEARSRLQVAALEAVGNAVLITDRQARIEWTNPAFETLTGYARHTAVGHRPSELVASGLQDKAYYESMWNTILSGKAWRGELVNKRKDGSLYDEELVIAPVKGAAGYISHFVGVKQDISERKRNEKALQQSHDLLNKLSAQVPGVIYQYRQYPDGRSCFPFVSQALWDMYGVKPEQVSEDGAAVFACLHPDDLADVMSSIQESARTLEPWHHEFRMAMRDQGMRWQLGDARPQKLDDGSILWHGFISDIDERRQAEEALSISQERWKFALEGAGDAVWQWDLQADMMVFSPRLHEILGIEEHEIKGGFDEWERYICPEDLPRVKADIDAYLHGNTVAFVTEHRALHKDGGWRWILARGMAISRDKQGKPLSMIGTQSDITDRKAADDQLRVAAAAFELQEGMMVTDARGTILRVNRAFEDLTGFASGEAVGKTPAVLKSGRQSQEFYKQMWQCIEQTGHWQGEIWNRKKSGEIYPEWLVITAVKDGIGQVTHYVAAFSDITTRKEAEAQIRNLAFYDPLTGLPNRRLLMDRANQALASSARSKRFGALMLLDLDHFKTLNDTLGHDVGDQLLVLVAQRLSSCVREGDTVARLGGDEFVVMLEELGLDEAAAAIQAEVIAEKIRVALNQPYVLRGVDAGDYRNTPSIGISQFFGHQQPVDVLLKQADIALYQAKDAGRNIIRFYNTAMQAVLQAKAILEAGLRDALASDALTLYYQPQVDQAHRVIGAEALLRWQPAGKPMALSAEFIPLAEETGLILPIGQWVLEKACAQLAVWAQQPESRDLVLAINVSARQFRQIDFVARISAALAASNANPRRLKLELTESMVINDIEDAVRKMHALQEMGVGFALDDFGTGYSSLSYLKRLPLDQVKIDQSFVRDIASDPSDAAIVQTIISMSHTLRLQVIAEGVETAAQAAFLEANGCQFYQGYLFGRPMPMGEFQRLLNSQVVTES